MEFHFIGNGLYSDKLEPALSPKYTLYHRTGRDSRFMFANLVHDSEFVCSNSLRIPFSESHFYDSQSIPFPTFKIQRSVVFHLPLRISPQTFCHKGLDSTTLICQVRWLDRPIHLQNSYTDCFQSVLANINNNRKIPNLCFLTAIFAIQSAGIQFGNQILIKSRFSRN